MKLSEYLNNTETTPTAFARQIGVSHTTVARWVTREISPSLEWMETIALVTNGAVMPNDFMRDV